MKNHWIKKAGIAFTILQSLEATEDIDMHTVQSHITSKWLVEDCLEPIMRNVRSMDDIYGALLRNPSCIIFLTDKEKIDTINLRLSFLKYPEIECLTRVLSIWNTLCTTYQLTKDSKHRYGHNEFGKVEKEFNLKKTTLPSAEKWNQTINFCRLHGQTITNVLQTHDPREARLTLLQRLME